MEPGIKPAIAASRTRQVGVLATSGTLAGKRFAGLVRRFADEAGVAVQTVACPQLVEQVEAGDLAGPQTRALIRRCLEPLRARGVDAIVLGCTHFHFVAPLVAELAGPAATIVDTAPAVARQVARVAEQQHIAAGQGRVRCVTTGDAAALAAVFAHLWDSGAVLEQVAV